MAKYRRRRRFRKSGRWSSNIYTFNNRNTISTPGQFADSITIAQNNTETSSSTITQAFTVKNIEVTATFEQDNVGTGFDDNRHIDGLIYYIMYVPQGYAIGVTLPYQHPEWIMAYKYVGNPISATQNNSQAEPIRVRTRLSRKLQSGDSIIFFYTGSIKDDEEISTADSTFRVNGLIRWWTKAN